MMSRILEGLKAHFNGLVVPEIWSSDEELKYVLMQQERIAQFWVRRILILSIITWCALLIADFLVSMQIMKLVVPYRITAILFLAFVMYLNEKRKSFAWQYGVSLLSCFVSSVLSALISVLYPAHMHAQIGALLLVLISGLGFFPIGVWQALTMMAMALLPYIFIYSLLGHVIKPPTLISMSIYVVPATFLLLLIRLNHQQTLISNGKIKYRMEGTIARQDNQIKIFRTMLNTIIDNACDGVVILNDDMIVIECNAKLAKIHSVPDKKSLIGRAIYSFYSDVNGPDFFRRQLNLLANRDRIMFEMKIRSRNVEISASQMTVGGNVFIIAYYRDITERKLLYQQIANSQRMESLTQLAFGMTHDVKNILATMQSYTDFISMISPDELPKTHNFLLQNAKTIQTEINDAIALVSSLLSLGKNKDGDLTMKPVNIGSIVRETKEIYARIMPRISISLDIDETPPIMGSKGHLSQVFANLFLNSRDAMPNGRGQIAVTASVSAAHSHVARYWKSTQVPSFVIISISDTGMGISEEHLPHIFQPFFSTKTHTTRSGCGLGLATAHRIIKNHGGDILVRSERGKGTVFEIHLPCISENCCSVSDFL